MGLSEQCVIVAALITVVNCAASSSHDILPSFSSYIQRYNRAYISNEQEYALRQKIYETRLQKVHHHNSLPRRLWDAAVNHLTDRSEEELSQLRGLRPIHSSNKAPGVVSIHKRGQFLSQIRSVVVPEEKSWAHLNALKEFQDQGGCGSCWAVATSLMLQANAEVYGLNRTFSPQELVNCVPNPHSCGGTGGCAGATVELGMNWVMAKGLATESSTPYKGMDEACSKTSTSLVSMGGIHDSAQNLAQMIAVGFHPAKQQVSPNPVADFQSLIGWERLPENQYQPLIEAVANRGPVAVSVGADGWSQYGKGVFNDCSKDATIDHAVVLIGYGIDKDKNSKFWLIRNSWGGSWGEDGNIRLFREEGDNSHCGTDSQPKQGTGCDNSPSTVHVCGMCGILYDSVVPHFEKASP